METLRKLIEAGTAKLNEWVLIEDQVLKAHSFDEGEVLQQVGFLSFLTSLKI